MRPFVEKAKQSMTEFSLSKLVSTVPSRTSLTNNVPPGNRGAKQRRGSVMLEKKNYKGAHKNPSLSLKHQLSR